MRPGDTPRFCHPEFGCDCDCEPLQTIGDLTALVERLGHMHLSRTLRLVKNHTGLYIFMPDDPIDGPYSGDIVAAAFTAAGAEMTGTSSVSEVEVAAVEAKAETSSRSSDYVDGHRAGYATGYADGKGLGYSDAKARVYAAISAFEDTSGGPRVPTRLLDSIKNVLGRGS